MPALALMHLLVRAHAEPREDVRSLHGESLAAQSLLLLLSIVVIVVIFVAAVAVAATPRASDGLQHQSTVVQVDRDVPGKEAILLDDMSLILRAMGQSPEVRPAAGPIRTLSMGGCVERLLCG